MCWWIKIAWYILVTIYEESQLIVGSLTTKVDTGTCGYDQLYCFFFLEGSAFMQDLDNWTLAYILPRVSVTLLVVTFIYQETFHAAEVEPKHCKKNEFFNLHCFRKEATQLCCHKWLSRDQGKYSDSTLHIWSYFWSISLTVITYFNWNIIFADYPFKRSFVEVAELAKL